MKPPSGQGHMPPASERRLRAALIREGTEEEHAGPAAFPTASWKPKPPNPTTSITNYINKKGC